MRVIYTTVDQEATGFYRVRGPAEALAAQGEVEVVPMPEINISCRAATNGEIVVSGVEGVPDADLLILQRPTNQRIVDAIPFFQRRGLAVVVDLDDDLERLTIRRSADSFDHPFLYFDPKSNPTENWAHLKRACRMADLVTVSTQALMRYGRSHGRVALIRNCVPESYLDLGSERDGRTVGWGGTVHNHPHDLKVTRGGVAQAVREMGARFLVVGGGEYVKEQLDLDDEPENTGVLTLSEYIPQLTRMDAAIAPLDDNAYTRAKSWLKALEAAATGAFPVTSDRPEYRELQKILGDLMILCPDRSRDWRRAVKTQLDRAQDESLRAELRERVREVTLESVAWYWAECWEAAIRYRKGARNAGRAA